MPKDQKGIGGISHVERSKSWQLRGATGAGHDVQNDSPTKDAPRPRSIAGVDSIRFAAAAWVALGHGARFPIQDLFEKQASLAAKIVVGISNMMFNGVDAVIVFFLISGLCIHYPNAESTKLNTIKFISRRLLRVGLPVFVVLVITKIAGDMYCDSVILVLWTIYCEIIYYLIYPLLFIVAAKITWPRLLIISSAISIIMLIINYNFLQLWQFGLWTWLFCLPFWLLGVGLADRFVLVRISLRRLWIWRGGAAAHGLLASVLIYHSPLVIGLVWTIPPFAIYCFFWLRRELAHFQNGASPVLETLGVASYSIYLTHDVPITFLKMHTLVRNDILRWIILLALLFALAALFYLIIERPSHALARRIGAQRAKLLPTTGAF